MLRVFKPTSVMSVGSWILTAYGGAATSAAALAEFDRLPRLRPVADGAAGLLGVGMATYTGALVADTAIPAWHEARRELPVLFAGSAATAAGAAAVALSPVTEAGPARRLTVLGAAVELTADRTMRRRLGPLGDVYREGDAGRFHRAAELLTAAGATTVAVVGRRSRVAAAAGAVAVLAGSVCQRWAVYKAGFQSAQDPEATLRPQRERLEARGAGVR
jgi:HAMP domain-containing protein